MSRTLAKMLHRAREQRCCPPLIRKKGKQALEAWEGSHCGGDGSSDGGDGGGGVDVHEEVVAVMMRVMVTVMMLMIIFGNVSFMRLLLFENVFYLGSLI